MPLLKTGVALHIIRTGSFTGVAEGVEHIKKTPPQTHKEGEFIYFATKAIAADIPNGNGDFFPWDHLLESYQTFIGRNLFLNHDSSSPRNAIGKVLDAYPVVDKDTGERYIECLAKIDAVANPDLARQVSTGILDACSMGCSVESSTCSICGHVIYSDQERKCHHMSKGLLKEYTTEIDLPEYKIVKGQRIKAFAINRGLNFTELSVVNVPAWDNAKIVQVIAKLRERIAQDPTAAVVQDLEDLLKMAEKPKEEEESKVEVKAEEAPKETPVVEAPKSESKAPVTETPTPEAPVSEETPEPVEGNTESRLKTLFKEKLSALDYMDIADHFKNKTKKVEASEETVDVPTNTTPDAPTPEAAPANASAEPQAEDKPVDVPEEAETKIEKEAEVEEPKKEEVPVTAEEKPERKLKAIFVSKPEKDASYWVVTEDGRPTLKATLGAIWGEHLNEVDDYASSTDYGEALLQRVRDEGVEKVAILTSATVYTEAAKPPEGAANGVESPVKPFTGNQGQTMPGNEPATSAKMRNPKWKPPAPNKADVATEKNLMAEQEKIVEVESAQEEGKDLESKDTGPASRGPVGPAGDKWPAGKGVGSDQYTPAGKMGKAKMKKLEEGVDMSGGDTGKASAGPSPAGGDQSPSSKSVGKSQYKLLGPTTGHSGVQKEAEEKPIEKKADVPVEVETPVAEAAEMPAEMPTEVPEAEAPAEMPEAEAPAEAPGEQCPYDEKGDMEKIEHMKSMLDAMEAREDLAKPRDVLSKAMEKYESAAIKADEKKAKEDEKAQAVTEKEEAARAKMEEKAQKMRDKVEADISKMLPKESEDEPEQEVASEKEAEEPKKEEKEEEKEASVEEKVEKASEEESKVEVEAVEEKPAETEEPKEEISKEAEAEEPEAEISYRERELEAQLTKLKLEQSLRAKAIRCQAIVDEMIDKNLISAEENDVQMHVQSGLPLFDARAAAFKEAIDKQCRDLLAMDEHTLQAFAKTVKRIQDKSDAPKPKGVLKKAFRLQYNEHTQEDTFLEDVFGQMGSQKGRTE